MSPGPVGAGRLARVTPMTYDAPRGGQEIVRDPVRGAGRDRAPRVGLRCDADPRMGVGHLLRQLALAEEFVDRGVEVTLLGQVTGSPLADRLLAAHGLAMVPVDEGPDALLAEVRRRGLDVVVLDGYRLPAALGITLRAAGTPVATMVDGTFGLHQDADLYVDQNFGATRPATVPADRGVLAGIEYALLRDVVRSRRRPAADAASSAAVPAEAALSGVAPADRTRAEAALPAAARGVGDAGRDEGSAPRLLCVFGGTDAYGAAPTVVSLLLGTGAPMQVVVVAGREQIVAELAAIRPGPGQRLEVVAPVDDLPGLAAGCDGVVSAAGTSIWEFFCLGLPTALVAVTANQLVGYEAVLGAGLVAPIGLLDGLRDDPTARTAAQEVLGRFAADAAWRSALGARGAALVDGDGRVRVADAILALR